MLKSATSVDSSLLEPSIKCTERSHKASRPTTTAAFLTVAARDHLSALRIALANDDNIILAHF